MSTSVPLAAYRDLLEASTGSDIIEKGIRSVRKLKRNDQNILFYQTGDFAEAYRRLEEGGQETF